MKNQVTIFVLQIILSDFWAHSCFRALNFFLFLSFLEYIMVIKEGGCNNHSDDLKMYTFLGHQTTLHICFQASILKSNFMFVRPLGYQFSRVFFARALTFGLGK